MDVIGALRRLDEAVLASPVRYTSHALAALGLLYALVGAGLVLLPASVLEPGDGGALLLLFPWSALPLARVLAGGRPRRVGVVVALAGLLQFGLLRGGWGIELAYLPLVLLGLLLMALPAYAGGTSPQG